MQIFNKKNFIPRTQDGKAQIVQNNNKMIQWKAMTGKENVKGLLLKAKVNETVVLRLLSAVDGSDEDNDTYHDANKAKHHIYIYTPSSL